MRKRKIILVIVSLTIVVSAYATMMYLSAKTFLCDSRKVADKFYTAIMVNDFESTEGIYTSSFLKTTSLEDFAIQINSYNSELGNVTCYKLFIGGSHTTPRNFGIVTETSLVYNVTRIRYNSTETLLLLKRNFGPILIEGYYVQSRGLEQVPKKVTQSSEYLLRLALYVAVLVAVILISKYKQKKE
jgi:hypothetical protein